MRFVQAMLMVVAFDVTLVGAITLSPLLAVSGLMCMGGAFFMPAIEEKGDILDAPS